MRFLMRAKRRLQGPRGGCDVVISPQRAYEIVLEHVQPMRVERTALGSAIGRSLAEDVRADRDMPPADR